MFLRKTATAALASFAFLTAATHAAPILHVSAQGSANAQAAEQAFLSSASSYVTETFEGFSASPGAQAATFTTSVGTFARDLAGQGGACNRGGYDCGAGLAALSADVTPFSGRSAIPAAAGNEQWLDSMDAQVMTLSPLAGVTSIGFYLTDPNDAGGRFSISGADFLLEDVFGTALANGSAYYLQLFDPQGIGTISFLANSANDGYGIDNVTVAWSVPEPGTVTLLGLGLVALIMVRRRRHSVLER